MDYQKESIEILCNFMCNQPNYSWSIANLISNSTHFPHYDCVENDNILGQICLINLNKVSVSTKFYTYKNKEYCNSETEDEWNNYNENLDTKLIKYYNKDY